VDAAPARNRGVRRDIQGLRAVAVGSVVLDHLVHWPSGGFVGVDIFFVISGFLITGILLKEFESTGTISFANFYRRRIRRIVPAATVTLTVAAIAAMLLLSTGAARSAVFDAVAGFFSVANWRLAIAGADYFQQGSAPSPVQHFWSLSVEEQFYFVWPALMLVSLVGVTRLASRLRGRPYSPRTIVRTVLGLLIGASFAWALFESVTNPAFAYFSTLSRAWELGLGALLAVSSGLFVGAPRVVRTLMAYAGLIGILISFFLISSASLFPAPSALLPVLSTVLVIASGIGEEPTNVRVLRNKLMTSVGDISYSLYLWHFPVIVLLAAIIPAPSRAHVALSLILMFVLAIGSYYLVELPFTKSPFLDRFPTKLGRQAAMRDWRNYWSPKITMGTAILTVAVLFTSALVIVVGQSARPEDGTDPVESVSQEFLNRPDMTPERAQLAQDVVAALNMKTWPTLSPTAGDAQLVGAPLEDGLGCAKTVVSDPMSCSFGNPSDPSIVVFGDSTGITLLPTIRAAYGQDHFIRGLTMASCPVIELVVNQDSPQRADDCEQHRAQSIAEIGRLRPDAVFITNNYEWASPERVVSGASDAALIAEWASAAKATADAVSSYTDTIVFVTPPPEGKVIGDCATAISSPIDCVADIPGTWRTALSAESSIVGDNVHVLNTSEWFCSESGRCPAFVDATPTKRDYVHTTTQWAVAMAPLFASEANRYIGVSN